MGAGSNNLVTDGLVYCLDAANRRCYSGTGTTGADLVLGGTTTLTNTVTFGSNNIGVFAFDGTDDYIDQDWSFTLGTGDLTIEFWVKMEGWVIHSNGANVFLSVVDPDVHEELQFGIENSTAQRLALYLDGGSNGSKTGDGVYSWSTDQWYHLVATRISSTVALYRDGVSLTVATGATNTGDVAAISTFLLGNQYKSGQYKHDFQGDMGPIRIYNKGLTAAEVKQNYEATKSRFLPRITKSGLVGNWDAGDPESYSGGSTWKDTANGVVGICYNDTSVANAAFSNNNGGYIEFDGTDDYVVVSDVSHLDLRDKLTMSCWAWFDGDGGGSNTIVFGKEKSGSAQYSMVRMNSGDTLDVGLHTGGWTDFFTSTVLSDDTWYHLSATYDRSNVKIYVNGSLVDTTAETDAISGDSERFVIGGLDWQNNSTVPDHPMNGRVAIVRMYNKALSAAEIMDNYNKTKARFGH